MLNCREMSELGSDIIDHQLNWRKRLSVMMHLRMCDHCSRYISQLRLTSDVLRALPIGTDTDDLRAVLAALELQHAQRKD
ncbi:MAG: anti-sigma factor [Gammaproteobacteria bacterium HGW-Gammaproteobacteria-11]|nr:MAG: anti-sigma factor [Gammaproteobacteria bacterium HGW-Gammaproteobacteria-11]